MDLRLRDKVALVTGSSRGLGLASASALAAEGCRVMLTARGRETLESAAATVRSLAGAADRVATIAADLSTPDGIARAVEGTAATFGGIDILVNNMGLARGTTLTETTDAECRRPSIRRSTRRFARRG